MGARGRRAVLVGVALAAVVAAVVSWVDVRLTWKAAPLPADRAVEALRARDDLSLVFVLVDTLRADRLGAYGHARPTSPTLDAVAARGVLFEDVLAQSSWTKASMASLWLGAYPARTGVLRHPHAIPEAATLPAEILRDAGFRTVGIWRNGWVANNFGFAQGFEVYYRPRPGRRAQALQRGNPAAHPLAGSDQDATDAAVEFLRAHRGERLFLYLHLMDVHQYVYDPDSARFGTDYVDAYDNAILWTDRNLARLLEELERVGMAERTLLVVASDHGEAFREHGAEGHGRDLYREVVRTPLVLGLPFPVEPGIRVRTPAQNVDVWPTLLDLLGLPPLPGAQGRSLVPQIEAAAAGAEQAAADAARTGFAQLDRTWGRVGADPRPLVAVSRGPLRLLYDPARPRALELYDHARDPAEQENVAAERPAEARALRREAERHLATPPADWGPPDERHLDEMRLQQLRALGYAVGGPPAAADARDAP